MARPASGTDLKLKAAGRTLLLEKGITGLSVREAEVLTKTQTEPTSTAKPGKGDAVSRQMQANQKRLEEALATKVRIKTKGNKGKIELDYFSPDEFNRLFELLLKAKPQ